MPRPSKQSSIEEAFISVLDILSDKLSKSDFDKICKKLKINSPNTKQEKVKAASPAPKKKPAKPKPEPLDFEFEDLDNIEDLVISSELSDDSEFTGFCSSCGDSVVVPFMWAIKSRNRTLRLPVQMCNKCKTIYTNYDWFAGFIESIVKSLGGNIR